MTKDEIKAMLVDDVEQRRTAVHAYIADTSNSFADRLEVYLATPFHLQGKHSWVWNPRKFEAKYGELEWYEVWVWERHDEVDIRSCIGNFLSNPDADSPFDADEDRATAEEKMKLLIEDALDDVCHSFAFDW